MTSHSSGSPGGAGAHRPERPVGQIQSGRRLAVARVAGRPILPAELSALVQNAFWLAGRTIEDGAITASRAQDGNFVCQKIVRAFLPEVEWGEISQAEALTIPGCQLPEALASGPASGDPGLAMVRPADMKGTRK